jgi:hypothetical protein
MLREPTFGTSNARVTALQYFTSTSLLFTSQDMALTSHQDDIFRGPMELTWLYILVYNPSIDIDKSLGRPVHVQNNPGANAQ